MKVSSPDSIVNPAQKALAKRLVKDIIDCDASILGLIVLDYHGEVLSVGRSSRLPKSEYVSPKLVKQFGKIVMVILSAAENAEQVMGGLEFMVGAFKNQKVLAFNLQEYNLSLALRLSPSANGKYVYDKISDIFGTSRS